MSDFGRRVPSDWVHVERYPLRAAKVPKKVENLIDGMHWRRKVVYDQGAEGACVGFSLSWAMTLLNSPVHDSHMYHAPWLYNEAQLVDEWNDTPPAEGTSLRAGFDVLRAKGHMLRETTVAVLEEGVETNTWATTVDEVRAAIGAGVPCVLGTHWYTDFDMPIKVGGHWWIGRAATLGVVRGGHAICIYGASDKRQAVRLVNTWGLSYPNVWMPYRVLERLLGEDGECAVPVDRV